MAATPPPPSLADIIAIAEQLRPQAPAPMIEPPERSIAKHAPTVIVAMVLALTGWVGSSITTLSTTVTRMSATVDAVQKSLTDLQATQGTTGAQLGDLKASAAKHDARADAIDADISRIKERVRMLEGQRPVHPRPSLADPY